MALVITWNEYNSALETKSADITDIAFGSADEADLTPANNKITAGDNSFEKFLKAEFTGMASEGITEIANTKVYKSAGNYKTAEALKCLGIAVSYSTPSESDSGDSDIPVSEPGSQNLGLNGSGTGVLGADGESDYMRMQRQTGATTPPGALNTLTITLLYDVS